MKIEVEADNLEQVRALVQMDGGRRHLTRQHGGRRKCVKPLRSGRKHDVKFEASAESIYERLRRIAATGVDYISVGALTHSPRAIDLSLELTHVVADRLSAQRLRAELGPGTIGREIIVLEETTSTNDVVLQMAKGGAPEGVVVFAEHQSAGPRPTRQYLGIGCGKRPLLFQCCSGQKPRLATRWKLAQQTAQIVATTIQSEFHLSATVKLPNDIYIGNRKVAGVLVEMRAQPKAPHLAVLGIGVNVNQMPHDFSEELRERATSLVIARRGPIDRTSFAVALLRNLDLLYRVTLFNCRASASLAEPRTGRRERLRYNFSRSTTRAFQFCPRRRRAATAMAIVTPRNFATPSIFPTPDRIQFVRVPSRFPHSSRWPSRIRRIPPPHSQSPGSALAQSPRHREFARSFQAFVLASPPR